MTKSAMFVASCVLAASVIGCRSGEVTDAKSTREVSPDGKTATQTRTRTVETPSAAKVRETETQKREVLQPSTRGSDATQRDPGNPVR